MTTNWKWHLHLFAAESQNTQASRNSMADCLATNVSYATRAQELLMFDRAVKYSTSGALPVQARGIAVPTKQAMRSCFEAFLPTLTLMRFFVVRAIDNGVGGKEGDLLLTNSLSSLAVVGTPDWTFARSFAAINDERNDKSQQPLLEIPSEVI